MSSIPTAQQALREAALLDDEKAAAVQARLTDIGLPPDYYAQAAVDLGFVQKGPALAALSKAWRMRPEELSAGHVDRSMLDPNAPFRSLLPFEWCKKARVLPLYADDSIFVAACSAFDPMTQDDIALRTGRACDFSVALAGDIDLLLSVADPARARVGPGTDARSLQNELLARGKIEEAGELGSSPSKGIFEILLKGETPLLSRENLKALLSACRDEQTSPLEAAVRLGLVEKGTLLRALSSAWGVPYIDLERDGPDLKTVSELRTPEFVWDSVLPLGEKDGVLRLAMNNPANRLLIERIEALTRKKVAPILALDWDIRRVLSRLGK